MATDNTNYRELERALREKAQFHHDAYDTGLKKNAAQHWGSYVAFDMAADMVRDAGVYQKISKDA